MRAMILAAGYGTGLRPLTATRPKALAEVKGTSILELVVERLKAAGVREIVINLHHHARQVEEFLAQKKGFGIRVEISREPSLLDTGGGLKKARGFFDDGRPFFLHNVDILSDIDLGRMLRVHERTGALATLAVDSRPSVRSLLVDEDGLLCGHADRESGRVRLVGKPRGPVREAAFCGIHVLSPGVFEAMEEEGRFSIIEAYLGLIGRGHVLRVFDVNGCFWQDVGKIEILESLQGSGGVVSADDAET